jgi:hypothetical protein
MPAPSTKTYTARAATWRYPIEETAVEAFLTNQQSPPILGVKALLELAKWLEGEHETHAPGGLESAAVGAPSTPDRSAGRIGSTPSRSAPAGGGEGR